MDVHAIELTGFMESEFQTVNDAAIEILGYQGRLIGGSKSAYRQTHPNNQPIFNANVCTSTKKIWYGDIDLTTDGERLQRLADRLGTPVYVLHEFDGRFNNADKPLIERAVAVFKVL